jgi:uncharacterized membrane protein (DUF2068 family)
MTSGTPRVCAVNWNRRSCARRGHLTYSPDEMALRDSLHVTTPAGEAWRCLRCGDYAVGSPHRAGPAALAPLAVHGRGRLDQFLLRTLAAAHLGRGLLALTVAYAVWRFRDPLASLRWVLSEDLPELRSLVVYDSSAVRAVAAAADHYAPGLGWVAGMLGAYGLVMAAIGAGLWFARRGAAYVAVSAALAFVPVGLATAGDDVSHAGVTAALLCDGLGVAYLLVSARLFGIRGGGAAAVRERRKRAFAQVVRAAGPAARAATLAPTR